MGVAIALPNNTWLLANWLAAMPVYLHASHMRLGHEQLRYPSGAIHAVDLMPWSACKQEVRTFDMVRHSKVQQKATSR